MYPKTLYRKKEATIAETFPCKIGVQDIGATSLRETLKFNELVWRCMSQYRPHMKL